MIVKGAPGLCGVSDLLDEEACGDGAGRSPACFSTSTLRSGSDVSMAVAEGMMLGAGEESSVWSRRSFSLRN